MSEESPEVSQHYSYFNLDGAKFRRLDRGMESVDDVLRGDRWVPYTGDCLKPALFGDKIEDPLAKPRTLGGGVI